MENRYLDIMNLETIPLDCYNCYLFTYKRGMYKNNFKHFMLELGIIFNFFNRLDYHVVIYDRNINDFDDIFNLDCISKLLGMDILVIVFNP